MKKLSALIVALCLTGLVVKADEAKKHKKLTTEQKTLQKSMLEKYDADKDGKLSKEEKAKISDEDKKKLDDAGLSHKKEKK
jgi:hypothetical protein